VCAKFNAIFENLSFLWWKCVQIGGKSHGFLGQFMHHLDTNNMLVNAWSDIGCCIWPLWTTMQSDLKVPRNALLIYNFSPKSQQLHVIVFTWIKQTRTAVDLFLLRLLRKVCKQREVLKRETWRARKPHLSISHSLHLKTACFHGPTQKIQLFCSRKQSLRKRRPCECTDSQSNAMIHFHKIS